LLKAVNKFFDRKMASPGKVVDTAGSDYFIFLKADRKMHKIAVREIIYVESMDEYVKVHLHGKVLVTRENISALEEKLSGQSFVRIHRSFIVSTKYVSSVSSDGVEVGNKLLPFGRAYKLSALAGLGIRSK